ncbi:MAG: hypothetical protein ACUZ77_12920 [Candidatus Brocadiales bacterium]
MINKFLPLVGIIVIIAQFIVWERIQTTKCSYEMAKLQKKLTGLQGKNRRLACDVSALRKPQRIVQSIQSMKLDLAQPLENRDRIAKAKQRLTPPKRGRPTKTTILASARGKLGSLNVYNSKRKVRTKGNRR